MQRILTFSAHIGNHAGTAPAAQGTTGPAFCKCPSANQYECLLPAGSGGKGCDGADDGQFPGLDGGVSGNWSAISELAPDASAQWFSPVALTHVEPSSYDSNDFHRAKWDYPNDLTRFGANSEAGVCDAGQCGLQGELWAHVMTFTPGSTENALDDAGINNHYMNATAQYVPVVTTTRWLNCTSAVYQPWLWGQQAYGPNTWGEDPTWIFPFSSGVAMQTGGGGVDATSGFTSGALSILEPLAGGESTSFLLDGDGARNLGTSKVLAAVITPVTGTPNVTVADALLSSGGQVDGKAAASGDSHNTISYAVAEALDPETGKLYALTQNGPTETLVMADVVGALGNFPYAQSSVSITGTSFSTALALQYSGANGKLYLLDRVASGDLYELRLSSITAGGAMTELWRTTGVSLSTFPSVFLSATPQGSLVVSLHAGGTAEAMVVDGSGTPSGSYLESGTITSRALIGSGGGVWFPIEVTDTSGYQNLAPTFQPRLAGAICGAAWLKSHAGSTGVLATSASSCNPIANGGFETGTLFDWAASGQSESIATAAHSGSFSAMLGSTSPTNGDSTVMQTLTVPSGGGTLNVWYSNVCPDTVYYDWFTATLQDTLGRTLATIVSKTCASSSAWTQATLSLAPYANQTVVVVLTSHDDGYYYDPTYTYVDDVSVQ